MAAKGRVLIVDDDPDLCEVMRCVLESDSFEVSTASTGKQGLRLMRESKPDLVFLDVIMVHPTEGVDVCQTIKEDPELWDIPVVVLTSILDSDYLGRFPTDQPLHAEQFLCKPVPLREILELANQYVS
jgi:two-component system alkaline phosphatase synthesis response regulator PhoP